MLNLDHEQAIAEAMLASGNVGEVVKEAYFRGLVNGQLEGLVNRKELIDDWPITELWKIYGLDKERND